MAQVRYGLVVTAATGSSINTAFSLVASSLPKAYKMTYWNETSQRVAFALATSLPTSTTTDQVFIPAQGVAADDSNYGQPVVSEGQNLYLRTDGASVVSMAVVFNLSI